MSFTIPKNPPAANPEWYEPQPRPESVRPATKTKQHADENKPVENGTDDSTKDIETPKPSRRADGEDEKDETTEAGTPTEGSPNADPANPRPSSRPTLNVGRLRSYHGTTRKIHLGDLAAFSAAAERPPSPHTRQMMLQRKQGLPSPSSEKVPLVNRRGGNPGLWDHEDMAKEMYGHY
ncbi:hypothetical protein BJ508DRAFT_327467 [Ascobolus immersus RN42]|uniref:Uncharacterized protein n=1 Tax=Ascobolus immersus RN42 TaxID=1160509 RepID=A0A3N4I2Y7_ASCIM|nr:hypothetical protein BJ508DRAFT_327467 [Ascobolus immersus RN42]